MVEAVLLGREAAVVQRLVVEKEEAVVLQDLEPVAEDHELRLLQWRGAVEADCPFEQEAEGRPFEEAAEGRPLLEDVVVVEH